CARKVVGGSRPGHVSHVRGTTSRLPRRKIEVAVIMSRRSIIPSKCDVTVHTLHSAVPRCGNTALTGLDVSLRGESHAWRVQRRPDNANSRDQKRVAGVY